MFDKLYPIKLKSSDKSVDLVEELKLQLNFTYELLELDHEDSDIFGSVSTDQIGLSKAT